MTLGEDAPTIGVIGGGQLGRMLAEAAAPLGIDLIVADPTPDPPAARVATAAMTGGFDDRETVAALADRVDVLTYEIELADPDILDAISEATDCPIHPAPSTLRMTQDKLLEKQRLDAAGIAVADFHAVNELADLQAAVDTFGLPVMLKARHGGYDGRGNTLIETRDAVEPAYRNAPGALLVENVIEFDRELSVIGVRGVDETTTFPVAENRHEREILRETIVPARTTAAIRDQAGRVVRDVLDCLDGYGVFGVELFEVDGDILVNEIAPRPHNSGHYTIEGTVTSQFEQHVRAVLGWPLGSTTLRTPAVMGNILGDEKPARPARLNGISTVLRTPGAALHWYGKREVRPLRKMGHVTCVPTDGEDHRELIDTARRLRDQLTFE